MILFLAVPMLAQDCAEITRFGIFDVRRTTKQIDLIDDVIHWLTVNKYQSESAAKSAAASFGIKIPDVPIQLNGDGTYGESHSSTWSEATAEYLKSHREQHERISQEFITANPQIVAAWQSCITQFNQAGLHTELVPVDACNSTFVAWYKPNSEGDSAPRMLTLRVEGGKCDKPPTNRVPYGGFNITCKRNGKDNIVVSLNTQKGNDFRKLESLPDDPEPPKQIMGTTFVASPTPTVCKVDRGSPGRSMSYSATCTAPGPITGATYSCEGPGCGYCYGLRNASRGPDWDINGNTLTWYRLCQGWAAALMIYTVAYNVPQPALVDNPNYLRDHEAWEKRQKALTCPMLIGSNYNW
jgi:hypothetical protein